MAIAPMRIAMRVFTRLPPWMNDGAIGGTMPPTHGRRRNPGARPGSGNPRRARLGPRSPPFRRRRAPVRAEAPLERGVQSPRVEAEDGLRVVEDEGGEAARSVAQRLVDAFERGCVDQLH